MGSGCAKVKEDNAAHAEQSGVNSEQETKDETVPDQEIRSNNNVMLEVKLDSDAQNRYTLLSTESKVIITHFYYHSPTKYQELVKNAHYNF